MTHDHCYSTIEDARAAGWIPVPERHMVLSTHQHIYVLARYGKYDLCVSAETEEPGVVYALQLRGPSEVDETSLLAQLVGPVESPGPVVRTYVRTERVRIEAAAEAGIEPSVLPMFRRSAFDAACRQAEADAAKASRWSEE